jgi:BlaI family penicillinase repressor
MAKNNEVPVSRREREIMDSLFRRGSASVSDVLTDLADPPGYSAVRAMLRRLEEKGHITHDNADGKYLYRPVASRKSARDSALERLVSTFFDGSPAKAAVALLDKASTDLSAEEIAQLRALISDAQKKGG